MNHKSGWYEHFVIFPWGMILQWHWTQDLLLIYKWINQWTCNTKLESTDLLSVVYHEKPMNLQLHQPTIENPRIYQLVVNMNIYILNCEIWLSITWYKTWEKNMGLFSGLPKECNRTKNRFRSLHTVAFGFASKWGHSTNTCGSSKLNSTLVITSKYLVVLDVHSPKNDTKHVSLCQVNYFCFHQYFTIFDDVSSVTMSHENLGLFFSVTGSAFSSAAAAILAFSCAQWEGIVDSNPPNE